MNVQEAIEVAKSRLVEVMPELTPETLHLEEVETPPHSSRWKFTFSAIFPLPTENRNTASLYELMRGRRLAKAVEIETTDGSLVSIRNAA